MTTYKNLEFTAARERAFEYLSRLFNVLKVANPSPTSQWMEIWSVELEVSEGNKTITIVVTVKLNPDFPLSLPSIYLSGEDITKFGYLPNIGTNGLICTFDSNTTIPNPETPEILIRSCVLQAKSIIESGLKGLDNHKKYDQEFIAYWENRYDDEDPVDCNVLSLIPDTRKSPDTITYVLLRKPLGKFSALLYSDKESFENIRSYLERQKVEFVEIPTFYLGQIDNLYPPFRLSNEEAIRLIETQGRLNAFKGYLASAPFLPLVVFTKVVEGRNLIFGWCHDKISTKRNKHGDGGKAKRYTRKLSSNEYQMLFSPRNGTILVKRFSPEVFTRERLIQRTSADYRQFEKINKLTVAVVGLGSVGSNLIPYLEAIGAVDFRLVDIDVVSIENVDRHLLGLADVGKPKTKAVRDYIQNKNPLSVVSTRESRIVELVNLEPKFFSACDFLFFCTGDINSEMWLLENLQEKNLWCRPSFFIWVEPYLAGGHCVYVNPKDKISLDKLFPDNKYIYNIIANEMHDKTVFTKRESGCQTTYLPYGMANLGMFLAALFPKIIEVLEESDKSRAFSWIGNTKELISMKFKLSKFGEEAEPYSIVERQIC